MAFMSKAEREAAQTLASFPVPVQPCQTFEPHTTATYLDPTRVELVGKPDFLCVQPRSYTHIEFKAGRLNNHRSKDSSFWALRNEYMRLTGIIDPVTYNFLAEFFDKHDKQFSLDNAWNHSVYKVLSLQADKGWQNYLVMFKQNPKREDAERYLAAGLVFCTVKNVQQLLATIELAEHGIFFPFTFRAQKYEFGLVPDGSSGGFSVETMQASNRVRLEASMAPANHGEDGETQPF